jgi:hypothetical protein
MDPVLSEEAIPCEGVWMKGKSRLFGLPRGNTVDWILSRAFSHVKYPYSGSCQGLVAVGMGVTLVVKPMPLGVGRRLVKIRKLDYPKFGATQ